MIFVIGASILGYSMYQKYKERNPSPIIVQDTQDRDLGAITLWFLDGTTLKPVDSSWSIAMGSFTIGNLIVDTFNATSTTASSTISFGLDLLSLGVGSTATTTILGDNATSTFNSGVRLTANHGIQVEDLVSCNTIDTDADGFFECGTDDTGASIDPNVIYDVFGGDTFYLASSTASDNLPWYFNNGFLAVGSSTNDGTLNITDTLTLDGLIISNNAGTSTFAGGLESPRIAGYEFLEGLVVNATSTTATSTITWGLQVNALDVQSTSATSTFANGLKITDGCLEIKGVCVGGTVSLTSGVTGTLPIANGGTNQTSFTDKQLIAYDGASQISTSTVYTDTGGTGLTASPTDGQLLIGTTNISGYSLATLTATANETDITNGSGTITIGIVGSPTLDGSNFTGMPAGAFDAGVIDGDDINSNIAGRSLTLTSASPDTLDLDVEIYTESKSLAIASSTMSTTTKAFSFQFANTITITEISCDSLPSGTSTVQLGEGVRTDLSAAVDDIMGAATDVAMPCGAEYTNATTSFQNAGIAAGAPVYFEVEDAEPTGVKPVVINMTIKYTIDD
ncbi:hypothetical protein LCGC14_1260530 [marine sediment metagenome]|uniref:Uncharacterized protein n=1 Tax=marine sediment metagenome TaxID=412755 RepID=A0A0F9P494_9ZZZZ